MNILKKFLILCGLILCCSRCDKEDTEPFTPIGDPPPLSPLLINQSGHRIAIVPDAPGTYLPDSLVIEHGQVSEIYYMVSVGYEEYDETKIYYDERYLIRIKQLPFYRRFSHLFAYVDKEIEGEWREVFTFVEEDYLYAIEHGIDLQATDQSE